MTKKFLAVLLIFCFREGNAAEGISLPQIRLVSGPEVVFNYSKETCDRLDIPDQPLRAVRNKDGVIVAIASHYVNRLLSGPSFKTLQHSCHIVYESVDSPFPASFNNKTWLSALWTDNGREIVALGHNEYHADEGGQGCLFHVMEQCWYNSITMLRSTDGGLSFRLERTAPILASPNTAETDQGARRGYFDPSNIVSLGEYKYSLIAQRGFGGGSDGRCLVRNLDPHKSDGWEILVDSKYVKSSGSPYLRSGQHPLCSPVTGLNGTLGSLARIRGTQLFVAFVMTSRKDGDFVSTFFSNDLVNWKPGSDLLKVSSFWSKDCEGARYSYPSVVDDESTGHNFDNVGRSAWLFLVKGDCRLDMTRDLVRYQLKIGE